MNKQTCYACKEILPVNMFAEGEQKLKQCKPCMRKYSKAHYEANKERRIANVRAAKERLYAEIVSIKEASPCMDCNKKYPACVMDFDHRDPTMKIADVGTMIQKCNRPKLFEEIAKCDLVCSNCHRLRTSNRRS